MFALFTILGLTFYCDNNVSLSVSLCAPVSELPASSSSGVTISRGPVTSGDPRYCYSSTQSVKNTLAVAMNTFVVTKI